MFRYLEWLWGEGPSLRVSQAYYGIWVLGCSFALCGKFGCRLPRARICDPEAPLGAWAQRTAFYNCDSNSSGDGGQGRALT